MNSLTLSVIALLVAVLVLLGWIVVLELRLRRFLKGGDGRSLEGTISAHGDALDELDAARRGILSTLEKIDMRMKKKIDGVRTLRFNPFGGTGQGGNQSFASAFLDEDGNGVVISSLYSREKVSVFAKPVVGRKSEFELSDEERAVLQ